MTNEKPTKKRTPLRADSVLMPVSRAHFRRIRAESRRRKAVGQPRKFAIEILDEALGIGLGSVVPITVKPTTTQEGRN